MATFTVTFDDGTTLTLDDADLTGSDGFGYADAITVDGTAFDFTFLGYIWAMVRHGQALYVGFATDSVTIGSGSKSFTTTKYRPWFVGSYVRIEDSSNSSNYMEGDITAYNADTGAITVNVTSTGGSGTISSWKFLSLGKEGSQGPSGDIGGPVSSTDNALVRWDGTGGSTVQNSGWTLSDANALTAGGAFSVVDQEVSRPKLKDYSETAVVANTGATYTIDLENGNVFNLTLTDNCTYTFSNPPASGSAGAFTLIQNQDGTGSRTVTWPASVEWDGGSAPTITSTASSTDVFTFITTDGGTTWYGFTGGQDFS